MGNPPIKETWIVDSWPAMSERSESNGASERAIELAVATIQEFRLSCALINPDNILAISSRSDFRCE